MRHHGKLFKEIYAYFYLCPCCGIPELSPEEVGNYGYCGLCTWEDDGQGDAEADERWGGPNGPYSLTRGRKNYDRYQTLEFPGDPYYFSSLERRMVKVDLEMAFLSLYEKESEEEVRAAVAVIKELHKRFADLYRSSATDEEESGKEP
jgi:hypothetical protein